MPRWWWDNFSPISVCSAKSRFSKTCGIIGIFQNYKICEKFERHKGYFVLLKSLPKVLQKVLPKTWFLLFFKVEVFRAFFSSTTRKCLFYGDKMPPNAVKCHGMQLAYKDLKSLEVTLVPVQVRLAALQICSEILIWVFGLLFLSGWRFVGYLSDLLLLRLCCELSTFSAQSKPDNVDCVDCSWLWKLHVPDNVDCVDCSWLLPIIK
jgi:hypothetical protein